MSDSQEQPDNPDSDERDDEFDPDAYADYYGERDDGGSDPDDSALRASSSGVGRDRDDEQEEGGPKMTLVEHLEELRYRLFRALAGLVVGMAATAVFGKWLIEVMRRPYITVMVNHNLKPDLHAQGLVTAVAMYFKIALISGLVVSAPWVFYHLWQFVGAGLYRREKKYIHYAVPSSAGLFILGAMFFFFVVSERIFSFLIGFTLWLELKPWFLFDNYVSFVTRMMLVFGLGFQTPLVVFLLGKMGLVTVKTLNKYRRHVIVLMLVIAALCTSPSPVDQILLAIPMWLLYELGVLLVWLLVERKREPETDEQ